jgi:hypothetical protein
MEQYLIDNNIISLYFSGRISKSANLFLSDVIDRIPNISVITQIEALSWVNPDKSKELIVYNFINDANIISISSSIVKQCVSIRRARKIKTPDAIIAATAIIHNYILITCDNDFNNIEGLEVINPNNL